MNLLKYSLGLNPELAYQPGTAITTGLDASGQLTMTVAKKPAAADVALAIEATSDLSSQNAWSTADVTLDQNTETILQARDNTPIASAPARFLRLRVTRP